MQMSGYKTGIYMYHRAHIPLKSYCIMKIHTSRKLFLVKKYFFDFMINQGGQIAQPLQNYEKAYNFCIFSPNTTKFYNIIRCYSI